eukprot:SAG31_NODE_1463_length_8238_cov_3.389851_10_plen_240_part_00
MQLLIHGPRRHLGFNTEEFVPTSRGYDYHYGHYNAAVEAYNHSVGADGTAVPRRGLDWHRNNVVVDGDGVTGIHTCQLLTADLVAKLHARGASPPSLDPDTKPLFVCVLPSLDTVEKPRHCNATDAFSRCMLCRYMAWHMVHEADGMQDPPWSVANASKPTKLNEAPPMYSAPFAANASDLSRRVFLGMVLLVDEAVGNVSTAWEASGLQRNGIMIMSSDNGSPPDQRVGYQGLLDKIG